MPFDAEYATHLTRDPLTITEPRERLEYLRDFLRKLPAERFDLSIYAGRGGEEDFSVDVEGDCGTAACICGWAVTKFALACTLDDDEAAGEELGLTRDESYALFIPAIDRTAVTPAQASHVIDHLLKTGEVDWSVAARGPQVVS